MSTLRAAVALLDRYEAIWRSRIDRIGELLAEEPQGEPQ